jgi:hypothetical protein
VGESLRGARDGPDERELVEVMEGLGEMDPSITQRLTLLVYDDIEAVPDHPVTVFGFGPGRLSRDEAGRVVHGELLPASGRYPQSATVWSGCTRPRTSTASRRRRVSGSRRTAWP